MKIEIWYEYLHQLNTEIRISGRLIILVTDNCPSHAPVDQPLKNYEGPPPPVLTHVKLVYPRKNTTPYLQPLDQGIIRSFKASYRRHYTEYLVIYFDTHHSTPPEIDILQAIHLIASSWSNILQKLSITAGKRHLFTLD